MQPLVSIIMPAYNASKFIRESIESIIGQTYSNWELLVIDDGSRDETVSIVKKYSQNDSRIVCIESEKNEGIATTRNKGILVAKGEYIAFLDSDDVWKTERLERQFVHIENTGAQFVYSAYEVMDEAGNYIKTITPYWKKVGYNKLLNTNVIACCTVLLKADLIKKDLMPDLKHEDYATWLNILQHNNIEAECVDGVLASYRKVQGSVSSKKLQTIGWNWNIYRHNQKLGFFRSVKQILSFVLLTGFKYLKR